MAYNTILFQQEAGIGTITFNRPKVLNALSAEVLAELSQALDEVRGNEAIRVLVLTGAGEKAFVAGADISELATYTPLQAKAFAASGQRVLNSLQELPIPVMAAVNGFALGGGLELAMACDFIYAADKATFGQPEINLGIIPGFGGTQRLARLVGGNLAKELILTGRMISAAEAKDLGLVNKVVPTASLIGEVLEVATTMASKGKVSLRAAKQVINHGLNVDLATACQLEVDAFALCLASEDAKEGTSAFLAKRPPAFKGSYR